MEYITYTQKIENVNYYKLAFDKHLIYSDCNLCNALDTEKIYFRDSQTAIIANKYSLFPQSKLIIDIKHDTYKLETFIKFCQNQIKANEIALINANYYSGIKTHLHAEIMPIHYININNLDFVFDNSVDEIITEFSNIFITKNNIYNIPVATSYFIKPLTTKEILGFIASHNTTILEKIQNIGFENYLTLNLGSNAFFSFKNLKVEKR